MKNFVFDNKIHLVLCAFFATLAWATLLENKISVIPVLTISLCVFSIYQVNRYTDVIEDQINAPAALYRAINNKSIILALVVISTIFSLSLSSLGGVWSLASIVFLYFLGIFYNMDINIAIIKIKLKRLKRVFLLKNIVPSFTWAFLIIIYPIIFSHQDIDFQDWLIFIYLCSQVFIIEVLWDIRDLKGDLACDLATLPIRYGISRSKKIIMTINIAIGVIILLFIIYNKLTPYALLINLYTFLFLPYYIKLYDSKRFKTEIASHLLIILITLTYIAMYLCLKLMSCCLI